MLTNLDGLRWRVVVDRWVWIYEFAPINRVTWRDQGTGDNGHGVCSIEPGKLHIEWTGSETKDHWDFPIMDPDHATGKCVMSGTTYDLTATALNYWLEPGDVVYEGAMIKKTTDKKTNPQGTRAYIVYDDEIRMGGTIAWICRNPGNIKVNAERSAEKKYHAFKGKQLKIGTWASFAIFPTEELGRQAVRGIINGYGNFTLLEAMKIYAQAGDFANDPAAYAKGLAEALSLIADPADSSKYVKSSATGPKLTANQIMVRKLNDAQWNDLLKGVVKQEGTAAGTTIKRTPGERVSRDQMRGMVRSAQ